MKNDNDIVVWIIEDEADFRTELGEMLAASRDLRCPRTFGTAEEAMPCFQGRELPHVVLVDIGLPGASGIQVIGSMKKRHPLLHFIVLTISEDRDSIFDAICAGASGYLLKNSPLEELLNGIRQVMAGGSPLSGSVAAMVLSAFKDRSNSVSNIELTEREIQILRLLADGLVKKEVAAAIHLATVTVDYHLRQVYGKLHVHSQAGAVGKAMRQGLI